MGQEFILGKGEALAILPIAYHLFGDRYPVYLGQTRWYELAIKQAIHIIHDGDWAKFSSLSL